MEHLNIKYSYDTLIISSVPINSGKRSSSTKSKIKLLKFIFSNLSLASLPLVGKRKKKKKKTVSFETTKSLKIKNLSISFEQYWTRYKTTTHNWYETAFKAFISILCSNCLPKKGASEANITEHKKSNNFSSVQMCFQP